MYRGQGEISIAIKLVKWGIEYRRRVYCKVYGKKKAHELHYRLSRCVNGLTVVPLMTKHRSGRRVKREESLADTADSGRGQNLSHGC